MTTGRANCYFTKGQPNHHVKAILVSVSDYSACAYAPDLPAGGNDVRLMAQALTAGLHVSPFHIWVKATDSGYVTRQSFLEGIGLFLRDIEPEDVLIFYFSGHGMVRHGKHYLVFSDGLLETQSVIDLFSELHADRRILFLDCCMSGVCGIHDTRRLEEDDGFGIDDLMDGGTAVFASGRAEEKAGYDSRAHASLFTVFLRNAIMNPYGSRDGQITLDRIRELVRMEAAAWNERHPDRQQHPVFRSSIGGTVFFRTANTEDAGRLGPGKRMCGHGSVLPETGDYIVAEVSPLHSQIAKRYVGKVILKHPVAERELIRINAEIVRFIRTLERYQSEQEAERWKGKPANLVFLYYGRSRLDVAQGLYECDTVWADETQDRTHWYRTGTHGHAAGGIRIRWNAAYPALREWTDQNTADGETAVRETKHLMRRMLSEGENVLRIYQEYENGTLNEREMEREVLEPCRRIDGLYLAASELPVPPEYLTGWSLLVSCVAGDSQEFSLILTGNNRKTPEGEIPEGEISEGEIPEGEISAGIISDLRQNGPCERHTAAGGSTGREIRSRLMAEAAERYHRDLEKLREEEALLKGKTELREKRS